MVGNLSKNKKLMWGEGCAVMGELCHLPRLLLTPEGLLPGMSSITFFAMYPVGCLP
jgi:hypothetical protein